MPKTKSTEEKELIINVKLTFEEEKRQFEDAVKLNKIDPANIPIAYSNVAKRTANALKVSETLVYSISKEQKTWSAVLPPKKRQGKQKFEVDSFTEGVIRRCILEAYSKKIFPTMDYLHRTLQADNNFPRMSRATLHRVMRRQLKIVFGKFEGKPVPMDRPDIAAARATYLRAIKRYRKEGRRIHYLDESWVNENLSQEKGWHVPKTAIVGMSNSNIHRDPWLRGVGYRFRDELLGGISSKPTGAGKRIIMINIGSADGFLGVGKEFIGKTGAADYHSEMNSEHFHEWIREVISVLPDQAVLVLDQASYHRTKTPETKNPTAAYRKAEIIEWLENKGVPIPSDVESFWNLRMVELMELARKHFVPAQYEIEKLIADENAGNPTRDIKLLWLPVAHCELNPIELIWAAIKREVRRRNTTFKIKDILPLLQEIVNSDYVGQLWPAVCRHVEELEDQIIEFENIAEEFLFARINPIIINTADESSSSASSESESSDEN